jgi:hypothetical protein
VNSHALRAARVTGRAVAAVALLATILALVPATAGAASDLGTAGPATSGAGTGVTGEKPESKVWWNDGRWWAPLFDTVSQTYHIEWLDTATTPARWVDTGTAVDNRPTSRADTLSVGSKLYIASHAKAASNADASSGKPARLYRYSYDAGTARYTLDAGFPVVMSSYSSETFVIERDTTGQLWATWTQGGAVYVNTTTGSDSSWGTPFVLPVTHATGINADDISTITSFAGHVGVMWSDQNSSTVYFSTHDDGTAASTWSAPSTVTVPGPNQADDHLSIRSLEGDASGRVFAVLKTSLDANGQSSAPQIVVVSRRTDGGGWDRATFGTVADCHTRPILVLDRTNGLVHVYATAPETGCKGTGTPGVIFEKTSPMSSLSFATGRGTPVLRDTADNDLNNVTTTKQTVSSTTGILLLASSESGARYWFTRESLGTPPPPPADTTPPTVTSVSPSAGSTGVSTGTTVRATFSEAMAASTVNGSTFTLTGPSGAVAATVAYDGTTRTATLTPSAPLDAGATYDATVTTGVTDTAGNALASPSTWRFITAASSAPQTVTLTPIADTYVRSDATGTSYGTATQLDVDGSPIQTSYLKWDLSSLAGRTIQSATLQVRVTDTGSTGLQTVHVVDDTSWGETAMTYATRPAIGASIGTLGPTNTNTSYTITLTGSALQSKLGALLSLAFDSSDADGVHLGSRETSSPVRLVLVVQ